MVVLYPVSLIYKFRSESKNIGSVMTDTSTSSSASSTSSLDSAKARRGKKDKSMQIEENSAKSPGNSNKSSHLKNGSESSEAINDEAISLNTSRLNAEADSADQVDAPKDNATHKKTSTSTIKENALKNNASEDSGKIIESTESVNIDDAIKVCSTVLPF